MSADWMGCCCFSSATKVSAGGQLEQPSEVKSSTRIGVRVREVWASAVLSRMVSGAIRPTLMAMVLIDSLGLMVRDTSFHIGRPVGVKDTSGCRIICVKE